MKKTKKIFLIAISLLLVLSAALVVYAETVTDEVEKAEAPFFRRMVSGRYWGRCLGLIGGSVEDGIIDEQTADNIEEYFRGKAEARVPLMQELLDNDLITEEQKSKIEEYLENKKTSRLDPLDELVNEGLITEEQKQALLEYNLGRADQLRDRMAGRMLDTLVDKEIITQEEADSIEAYMEQNQEAIAESGKTLIEVLVDNSLLTQEQADQITELRPFSGMPGIKGRPGGRPGMCGFRR